MPRARSSRMTHTLRDGRVITIAVELITPERAAELLRTNINNRNIRKNVVSVYAESMQRDEWHFTGDTIKLDENDHGLDLQHRLTAIVVSGLAQEMIVVSGLSPDAWAAIDTGPHRSLSDALRRTGETDCKNLAAELGWLYRFQRAADGDDVLGDPRVQYYKRPTIFQSFQLLDVEGPLGCREALKTAATISKSVTMSPGLHGALIHLLSKLDKNATSTFYEGVKTGTGLKVGSPVLLLRDYLLKIRSLPVTTPQERIAAYTIKAWNLYVGGTTLKQLSWNASSGEPFPIPRIPL